MKSIEVTWPDMQARAGEKRIIPPLPNNKEFLISEIEEAVKFARDLQIKIGSFNVVNLHIVTKMEINFREIPKLNSLAPEEPETTDISNHYSGGILTFKDIWVNLKEKIQSKSSDAFGEEQAIPSGPGSIRSNERHLVFDEVIGIMESWERKVTEVVLTEKRS